MKLKNLVKKGGVADIVTLMIIVGLVIALIIAVVLPMIKNVQGTGSKDGSQLKGLEAYTSNVGSVDANGNILSQGANLN